MRAVQRRSGVLALCLLWAACDSASKNIDPFPIGIDLRSGPVILAALDEDGEIVEIVVDVLSPVTVMDSYEIGQESQLPARRLIDLTLVGIDRDGLPTVPRVRFPNTAAFDLHPCAVGELCKVGSSDDLRDIRGILGADILSRGSVRFDFSDQEIRFFPDAAGGDAERTRACDAVFDGPFGGGGSLLIGGSEVSYGADRPTIGVCMHTESIALDLPDELDEDGNDPRDVLKGGYDTQMAFSTAIGPSLLTETAYSRISRDGVLPALETLTVFDLYLPSGPVSARLGRIPYLAIVGEMGADSDRRGPCRELFANALMRFPESCARPDVDCPCPDDQIECKAAAVIEMNATVEIAIVDDSIPLLQALRDELRPDVPELDGVLGTQALHALRVEFDYPNNRILMRCRDINDCATRPQVRSQDNIEDLASCREAEALLRAPSAVNHK